MDAGDTGQNERALVRAARQQVHGGQSDGAGALQASTQDLAQPGIPDDAFPGYTMLREIGRAGQAVVYRATQISTKRKVAIKVLKEGRFAAAAERSRFQREVEILGQLQHPNIVAIHDSGEVDGRLYYVMDYIAGEPLDRSEEARHGTIESKVRLFRKICSAVNAAHLKGIIHRDLKPGNILVDGAGEPQVLDFGLAKVALADRSPATMTATGQFMGSLPWSSPEQAEAIPAMIDMRTDVYALGVIFYQMLTGRFPYEVMGSMRDVLDRIISAEPQKPSTLSREVNDELETIVLKCLQKERDRRYQSAGELARDLGHYLAAEPIEAKRDSTWYVLSKTLRRYRVPVAIAVAFTLLAVASAVSLYVLLRSEAAQRDLAERRTEEVLRLADLKRVADARTAADRLWPAHPENVAAMRAWLNGQARSLEENLATHEAMLVKLRSTALPYDTAQQQRDRHSHPRAAELATLRARLAQLERQLNAAQQTQVTGDGEPAGRVNALRTQISALRQEREAVRAAFAERRTWEFDDPETQWWHDMLTQLVVELRAFLAPDPRIGAVASVKARIDLAEHIGRLSVTDDAAARLWHAAIADIACREVYGGLLLTPQVGLLPLRADPRSGLWEFWHVQSGNRPVPNPDPSAPNPWLINGDTGVVLVLLPGGTFWMGAQAQDATKRHHDPEAYPAEHPVHEVALEPFFISRYEMTQGQWQRFTDENPSRYVLPFPMERERTDLAHPVEYVSWLQCQRVLGRLGLELPTEAQWEYAARAGTDTVWWTGNEVASLQGAANIADAGSKKYAYEHWAYDEAIRDGHFLHAPVGTYAANAFGLHDVLGNNWEWCRDRMASYELVPRTGDGLREAAISPQRMVRGGGFNQPAVFSRSTHRFSSMPDYVTNHLGVRPARSIQRSTQHASSVGD